MAKSLDGMVDEFRNRPLEGGPYTYIWIDALTQRCRDGGSRPRLAVKVETFLRAAGAS